MRVLGVIPARLGSTRLPNKPLQLLAGEPLITRVIQRVVEHGWSSRSWWSPPTRTMIAQVVERAGVRAVLTARRPPRRHRPGGRGRGPARVRGFDVVANVQGDEPFLPREALAGAIDRIAQGDDIGTAAAPLAAELAADPVAGQGGDRCRRAGRCISRGRPFPIGASRPTRPTGSTGSTSGIYVYTRAALRALGGRAAEPGGAGRAAGAAPRAALRSHDRRGPADRAGAARRGHAGRPSTGGSPLARTSGVSL